MQFYNFQGSPGNDRKEDNFLDRLQTAVKAFEREASTTKTIHADSDSIQQLLNIFSDILEDGFEGPSDDDNDSSHYWSTVSSVIDSIPMRFVGSLEKFDTDSEKAIVWILIELYSKNLSNVFNDILNKPQILQFYNERATIRLKASKIKEILGQLDQMNYSIESKFLKVYEENKDQFGDEEEEEEGEPSDIGSVLVRDSNTSQQTTGWASNLYQRKTQESDSYSRNTTSDLTRPVSHREPTVETTPTPTDMSKSQPVQIKRLVTHVDEVKQNLQRYKTLLKRPTLVGRDDDEDESNTFVRDDYRKDFEERNKNTPFGFISRVFEPMNSLKGEVTKKIMRKSSSYDKIDARKQSGKGDYVRSRGNLDEPTDTGNRRESRRSRRSSYEFRRKETGRGHSKDQDEGYRSGLREFRASELRSMKNSQLLYYQKYQGIQLQFEYRAQPVQMVTAEQQGYKCFDCGIELNKILLKIWPRKSYCHYTGYWYCSTCMGKEKHLIPWYVKSNFDFTLYHVCKKAREELKKFYDKPNMLFDHKEKVVLDNKDFYDTLVMKRQLHLMFDMICESPYVLDLLGANANLLLKQNLFSMKNLSEIKNGTMTRYMEKCYAMLTSHVNGCSICQAKGKCCPVCNNKTKIFPYDIRNTSVCRNCKYLYHSRCLQLKKCIVCQHNS